MAPHRQPAQAATAIVRERFLLGSSLPEDVALHIVEDGLPGALRSKPTAIYSSPEVPLDLTEAQATDLVHRLAAVDEAKLDRLVTPHLDVLAGSSPSELS
jgi:hypothetical protein